MEGRCDNEPLDSADDICELCGGEFCDACLIFPRGRKKPVCKTCAIMNSGVRGGVKTERKADRRTAKKRRENLIETKDERDSGRFVFFDEEGEDLDLPLESEPESEEVRRRRVTFGRRKKEATGATDSSINNKSSADDEGADSDQDSAGSTESELPTVPVPTRAPVNNSAPTATELLARLREDDWLAREAMPTTGPTPAAPVATPPPAPSSSSQTADPFDQTVDPFAMQDPFAAESAAQPVVHSAPVAQPPLAETYLAATSHRATMADAPAIPPAAEAPVNMSPVVAAPEVAAPVIETPVVAVPVIEEPAGIPPASAVTQTFEPAPQPVFAPPPQGPAETHLKSSDRPSLTARLGEVPGVVPPSLGLASDPFAEAASPAPNPIPEPRPTPQPDLVGATSARPMPTRGPMEPAPLPRYEPAPLAAVPTSSTAAKADVDEDGNWVPPALRGMAPKAVRDADVLPRRRQS